MHVNTLRFKAEPWVDENVLKHFCVALDLSLPKIGVRHTSDGATVTLAVSEQDVSKLDGVKYSLPWDGRRAHLRFTKGESATGVGKIDVKFNEDPDKTKIGIRSSHGLVTARAYSKMSVDDQKHVEL